MKIITQIILLVFTLLSVSCKEDGITLKKVSDETTTVTSSSFVSHYITSRFTYTGEIPFLETDGGKTIVEVFLDKVELFPKTEKTKSLNTMLENQFNAIVLEAKNAYADNINIIEELGYGIMGISFKMDTTIAYIDENIVSFSSNTYMYTGGAHGITHMQNDAYNLETDKKIALADIFFDAENPELVALLHDKLLLDRSKDQYFEFDSIRLTENFIVQEDGLRFTYNHYEIAPYSEGITDIDFTFDEIREFVKEDSPVGYVFN